MTTAPSTPIPVLLAEDEPVLARRLARLIKDSWPEAEVLPVADNGAAAVALALSHLPRVVFLDIHMPACSGLEAAQAILEDWPEGPPLPQLVFVTAFSQYAVQAFEHEAVDYLLKPVNAERLQATVQRLKHRLRQQSIEASAQAPAEEAAAIGLGDELRRLSSSMQPPGRAEAGRLTLIHAAVGQLTHLIPVGDVLYFEAAEKYLRVVTRQREALIRMTLRELLARLPAEQFWQIHRGTVVQVAEVSHVERTGEGRLFVHLRDHAGGRLVVSRLFAHRFKAM